MTDTPIEAIPEVLFDCNCSGCMEYRIHIKDPGMKCLSRQGFFLVEHVAVDPTTNKLTTTDLTLQRYPS